MTDDLFDQSAFTAAHNALSGRYNGDITLTAEHITRILCAQQERHGMRYMKRLIQSYTARESFVTQLAGLAEAQDVRGGVEHARPLLDNAVALAAKALWDSTTRQTARAQR